MEKVKELASTFIADDLVSVELQDGGTFTVQKALLSGASEYFRKALDGRFLESHNRTLHLPGCSTASFELILYWLVKLRLPEFSDELEDQCVNMDSYEESVGPEARATAVEMVNLWLCCDMLLMPALQNESARRLTDLLCIFGNSPEAMRLAFAGTPPGSALRRLLEDHGELEKVGSIPEFLATLFRTLSSCPMEGCDVVLCIEDGHRIPDSADFMVPEKKG
ncbi:hypothetical protein TI39_contig412g00013 [Zymoseptoria brevis]|uniref:BTB domain-containing protein n=1 Tax=Zymoseptoria brevis TaxID=1047168 RepID=A0A0F4GQC8_9PEZI|nr:hypothetical protein TI39_contig412g00013 [Zymoseptoria brevis]